MEDISWINLEILKAALKISVNQSNDDFIGINGEIKPNQEELQDYFQWKMIFDKNTDILNQTGNNIIKRSM